MNFKGGGLKRRVMVWIFFIGFFQESLLQAAPVSPNHRLTFRLRAEPETLDWNLAHTPVEADLLTNLMEGLVSFDEKSQVKPALAQTWTLSPDGKTYVFHLKPGVKWSDGLVLKAQDFVFSWKRLLSRILAAPYAYLLFDVQGAEDYYRGVLSDFSKVGIQALDDLTLQVKLKYPVSQWIQTLAFWPTYPLRQDSVEKHGGSWTSPAKLLTLGPYRLETHDFDSKFILKPNPFYHGILGNVDEVVARIVKSDREALRLYEAGELDFLSDLSQSDVKSLAGRSDLKKFPQLKTAYLSFTVDQYPVSSVNMRRAIMMALDKSKLSKVFNLSQSPATSLIPPGLLGYSSKIGLSYNLKKAKQEMALARVDSNSNIKIHYLLPDWDKSVAVGQWVHDELSKNLGIDVILQPLDHLSYRAQLDFRKAAIADCSWTADTPDPHSFISVFLSNSGNNSSNFKSQSFDEKVEQARRSSDLKERESLYLSLQKTLLEEEVVVYPIYYESNLSLIRPRVRDIEVNSLGYLYLRRVDVVP